MDNRYTSYKEMMKYLDAQMNLGKRWVAYEGLGLPGDLLSLECFESSIEANNYCDANLYRTTGDGHVEEVNYRFHAIENLIKELQLEKGVMPLMLVTPAAVEEMLQRHGIVAFSDFLHPVASSGLPYGGILPVMKPLLVTPIELIERFHIVRHVHESVGLIYELGHSRRIVASYQDYDKARDALVQHAQELPANTKHMSYDLILVGEFKNQVLRLDYEGYPEFNSGLALKRLYYSEGQLKIKMMHDPCKEMTINQRLFTRLSEEKRELIFLDDRLEEIVPGATVQSFFGSNFWTNMDLLLHIGLSSRQAQADAKQIAVGPSPEASVDPAKRLLKIACSRRVNTRSKKRKKGG